MKKKKLKAKVGNIFEQKQEIFGHIAQANFTSCLKIYFVYLPTRLLFINRIVIVIEEVNVKVLPFEGWLLVASSAFAHNCLLTSKEEIVISRFSFDIRFNMNHSKFSWLKNGSI